MRRRGLALAAVPLLAAPSTTAAVAASPVVVRYLCLGEVATHAGSPGPDRIEGTPGRDVIAGRGGDDVIRGGDGRDVICGGAGDDRLEGRYGDDYVAGGGGIDRLDGGPGDDLLLGGGESDHLEGGDGFDSDTLVGGAGSDSMNGGDGESDRDFLFGGAGNDNVSGGVGGSDMLYGGEGDDNMWQGIVSYEFARQGVAVDLTLGPGQVNATGEGSDRVHELDGVTGSDFDDSISYDGDERMSFRGRGGDDVIAAGSGHDSVGGGPGSDELDGGPGDDRLTFADSPVGVTVRLAEGSAQDDGADTFAGFEHVEGSFFADHLTGDDRPNLLWGSYGRNTIFGLGGDDYIDFADEGDAGEGVDECVWSEIPCERDWHFDPPALPYVTHPAQGGELDDLRAVTGEIAGGLGGPRGSDVLVAIRRLAPDGCRWWDAGAGAFVRGPCGVPLDNRVQVREWTWRLPVGAPLEPGAYEVGVTWAAESYRDHYSRCNGAFAPMCVSFDVR